MHIHENKSAHGYCYYREHAALGSGMRPGEAKTAGFLFTLSMAIQNSYTDEN